MSHTHTVPIVPVNQSNITFRYFDEVWKLSVFTTRSASKIVSVMTALTHTPHHSNSNLGSNIRTFDLYFDLEDGTCPQRHFVMVYTDEACPFQWCIPSRVDAAVSVTLLFEISALASIEDGGRTKSGVESVIMHGFRKLLHKCLSHTCAHNFVTGSCWSRKLHSRILQLENGKPVFRIFLSNAWPQSTGKGWSWRAYFGVISMLIPIFPIAVEWYLSISPTVFSKIDQTSEHEERTRFSESIWRQINRVTATLQQIF